MFGKYLFSATSPFIGFYPAADKHRLYPQCNAGSVRTRLPYTQGKLSDQPEHFFSRKLYCGWIVLHNRQTLGIVHISK